MQKYRSIFIKFPFLLLSVIFVSCSPKSRGIRVVGSDTMLELMQQEVEAFASTDLGRDSGSIMVSGGGSTVGFHSFVSGEADVAMMSRDMFPEEKETLEKEGIGYRLFSIAKDMLVIIVHKENPLQDITLSQLSDVYQGKITNWKEIGGQDLPITLVGRSSSSGTYGYFQEAVLKSQDYSTEMITTSSNSQIIQAVEDTPSAIGYISFGYFHPDQRNIKALAVQNVDPTRVNLENTSSLEAYPLSRSIFILIRDEITEDTQINFMNFLLNSQDSTTIIRENGFVPTLLEILPQQ